MYLNNAGVDLVVKEYEKDTKALKEELFKICWYMRGSVSLSESFLLSIDDRVIIGALIEENLKTTKDTNLPFF